MKQEMQLSQKALGGKSDNRGNFPKVLFTLTHRACAIGS